jgi:hypothetical protein
MYDEIDDAIKETTRELTIQPSLELPDKVRRGSWSWRAASRSVSPLREPGELCNGRMRESRREL